MASNQVAFLHELEASLPGGTVLTDPDVTDRYRFDRTTWLTPGRPAAVALPSSTGEVAAAVKVAAAHGVPIVPRGAGSSLSGGSQAVDGALTLSLEKLDRIVDADPGDQLITVEPGVLNADVSAAVWDDGLFYPPDPASKDFCSIGGNVATNAGGLCCVKYGVTRDWVKRLEVVLADGTVIETGHDTLKGVAGLDLTGLFVGSEGTLGIVTRVTLRLRRRPQGTATAVAVFPTLSAAGRAVADLATSEVTPSLLEIMDNPTINAVEDATRMGLDRDAAALLLLSSDSPEPLRGQEVADAAQRCESAGATEVAATDDADAADALLQARRMVGPVLEQLGEPIWDDVCVPRSRIPDLLGRIEDIAATHRTEVFTFGHAGDGNMHPVLLVRRDDPDGRDRALAAFDRIVEATLELGGTITGEHGVGSIKAHFLEREVGPANLALQRRIKHTLDPDGLLNPGRWL